MYLKINLSISKKAIQPKEACLEALSWQSCREWNHSSNMWGSFNFALRSHKQKTKVETAPADNPELRLGPHS